MSNEDLLLENLNLCFAIIETNIVTISGPIIGVGSLIDKDLAEKSLSMVYIILTRILDGECHGMKWEEFAYD
ncbi:hypothetical protein NVP2275O_234 [Vibrio phage 2.275.O._10N.286.54.E11]|nr:hypothetical protein NVP2275O_234 [Vibrio phage 2.275.O._10N.286.54.E11]